MQAVFDVATYLTDKGGDLRFQRVRGFILFFYVLTTICLDLTVHPLLQIYQQNPVGYTRHVCMYILKLIL